MTTQSLHARLTLLFESLKQIQQLIIRLAKLPANSDAGLSNLDDGDARIELSSEIHQGLKELDEEFELLRQESEDLINSYSWSPAGRNRDSGPGRAKTDLATKISRLGEDLRM